MDGPGRMTAIEKKHLIELVTKHKDVLDNKKTDAESIITKRKTWEEVEVEFNRQRHVTKRTWKQLRKSWENMKAKKKRQHLDATRRRMGNGGGPYVLNNTDTTPELEIIVPSVAHHVHNVSDGDNDVLEDTVEFIIDDAEEVSAHSGHQAAHEGVVTRVKCIATPTTPPERQGPRRSAVERQVQASPREVSHDTKDETFIFEMRRELAEMDVKIKENELASSVARRTAAEADAEAAKVRLAIAEEELAKAREARGYQREIYEMQEELLRKRMEMSPQYPR